ncbi:hypothetical protein SAMN02745154_00313 [Mycoplasmopsis verecunda]|uniref:Uncharacterized protein n=1 Tax=Mycoplasmopsis verecunda TaxID=171291 RepID=A0A1T4L414_9BACT|nr:hypothetical protein SAMN02745154_00313 [Mycoplasmopsis verecunda]
MFIKERFSKYQNIANAISLCFSVIGFISLFTYIGLFSKLDNINENYSNVSLAFFKVNEKVYKWISIVYKIIKYLLMLFLFIIAIGYCIYYGYVVNINAGEQFSKVWFSFFTATIIMLQLFLITVWDIIKLSNYIIQQHKN